MPAAAVLPMSRKANLPSSGHSLKVSRTTGRSGVILTIAESPVLIVLGFSSVGWPVLGSILAIISVIVAATWAVCAWRTGVYPAAMAVGWKTTIICAMRSEEHTSEL